MPLESCPKCGYAVSVVDHQCRHCAGLAQTIPTLGGLDVTTVSKVILSALIIGGTIYWAFFAR